MGHRHLAVHGQAMVQEASLVRINSSMNLELVLLADWLVTLMVLGHPSSMNLELVLLADWLVTLMVLGHPGDQIFPKESHFLRYLLPDKALLTSFKALLTLLYDGWRG